MSIRQYRALCAIAEQRSFARAAEALNVTQSAISMQIAALEESLGATLFDRRRRPPQLTRAGRVALTHAQTIVAQHDAMIDQIATLSSSRGEFRLGVIPTVLTSLLPEALVRLRAEHPELRVSIVSALSGDLADMAASGEVDASLMHAPSEMNPALEWRPIARQRIVVLAPPGSVGDDAAAVFARHPYIRFNRRAWVAPLIERRLEALGLTLRPNTELESIEAIHILVGLGLGASILPDVGPAPGARPGIRRIDLGPEPMFRDIGLASHADSVKKTARGIVGDAFAAAVSDREARAVPPEGA